MKTPTFKSFPRKVQEEMAQELKAAADHITAKYGLSSVALYRCGNPTSFVIGLWCCANNITESINSALASKTDAELAKEKIMLSNAGLPIDIIGKEIYLSSAFYVIVGVNEKSVRYPWIGISKKDGRVKRFSESDIIRRITTLRTYHVEKHNLGVHTLEIQ
jgi:hypothetical protein